jgi:hypothetical protein
MLDLEQRQAEAQERAKELGIAREAAAARLAELLRERDPGLREEGLRQEQLREEMLYEASRPASRSNDLQPQRKPLEALRHASIVGLVKRTRQPMSPQLRAVLTGAAAVSVLFVIGIVLGVLQPHTPLASTTSRPASTSAPASSSGVTVQTGGVTVKAGTPATTSSGANTAPATKAQSAPASAAAASQDSTPVKPSPRVAQTRRQLAGEGEQDIGDDVVIRHFNQPVPTQKPKQSGQSAGLKHFSDMEN